MSLDFVAKESVIWVPVSPVPPCSSELVERGFCGLVTPVTGLGEARAEFELSRLLLSLSSLVGCR